MNGQTDSRYQDFNFDVAGVGTSRDISPGFAVASLRIQNPTAMWLFIPQVQQYIPPNVLGAVVSIKPTARNVTVRYVDAPVGGVASAATGGPLQITAFPIDLNDYQGLDYGLNQLLEQLDTSIQQLIDALNNPNRTFVATTITASTTSFTNLVLVAAPGAGQRIRVFTLTTSENPNSATLWQLCLIGNGGSAVADSFWMTMSSPNNNGQISGDTGYPLSENVPLTLRYRPDIASGDTESIAVIYSIEAV